jgi:hypothetical protein
MYSGRPLRFVQDRYEGASLPGGPQEQDDGGRDEAKEPAGALADERVHGDAEADERSGEDESKRQLRPEAEQLDETLVDQYGQRAEVPIVRGEDRVSGQARALQEEIPIVVEEGEPRTEDHYSRRREGADHAEQRQHRELCPSVGDPPPTRPHGAR